MRTYRRIKSLATGVNSPANKGLLLTITTGSATVTFVCLDAVGNSVNVALTLGVGNSIFPVYVKSWSKTGAGTVVAYELN
jgi:hypothetical protein